MSVSGGGVRLLFSSFVECESVSVLVFFCVVLPMFMW